jgi:hypothetical protein
VDYLFVGLETFSPQMIGGMSKDVGRRGAPWMVRAERAFEILADARIQGGVAVLFGLGESHASRLALLEHVREWRATLGMPWPVSLNWAVQHPLFGSDGGCGYTYTDWAVPEGPFLGAFRDFGEASLRYPLAGVSVPALSEVLEVQAAVADLLRPPARVPHS